MFEIRKEASFEASHKIEGHKDPITGEDGKCSRLHGHSYRVALVMSSEFTQEIGFVVDYYLLGKILKDFCEMFDHRHLNDFSCFTEPEGNATAEMIARQLYFFADTSLRAHLPEYESGKINLVFAECKETDSSYARFWR